MIHLITRMTSSLLVFGFFISCSTLSPTSEHSNPSDDLTQTELQQEIDSLNQQIKEGDGTADLLYKKGIFLNSLAQKKEDPSQRSALYASVNQSLRKASRLYKETSRNDEEQKAEELLQVSWSNEHNQGVQIIQGDSTAERPDLNKAAAHFKNATIIIPDSSISYKMEARAFYQLQQTGQAIQTLERAQDSIDTLPLPLSEQLAFLYLENDQPLEAIALYEETGSFSDQNLNLLHGLSNAYMKANQHQKAIEILKQLTASEPKNILYGQSLATEFYHLASERLDSVVSKLNEGMSLEQTNLSKVDSLLEQAENQYSRLIDHTPQHQELQLNFAHFYQNSGAIYQRLLPLVEGEHKQEIEKNIKQFLLASLPLYEELSGQGNDEIWEDLYQIYSYLGMQEKARKAKANF